jgi:hypothetical protein
MNTSLWVWPADAKAQQRTLTKVSQSEHLMTALQALAKSGDGLSNARMDDALSDYSEWETRWVVDQLISLGFADYKVDFFGGPGKYILTELGRNALAAITGKPVQAQPQAPPTPSPAKPQAQSPATAQPK